MFNKFTHRLDQGQSAQGLRGRKAFFAPLLGIAIVFACTGSGVVAEPSLAQSADGAVVESASAPESLNKRTQDEDKMERTRALVEAGVRAQLRKQDAGEPAGPISAYSGPGRVFQGLGLCLVVLFVGLHLYKRFGKGGPTVTARTLRVVEKLPLTGRTALLLVHAGKDQYLVGVGPEPVSIVRATGLQDEPAVSFDRSLELITHRDARKEKEGGVCA